MDKTKKPLQLRRIGGFITLETYLKLRAKLAVQEKSITEWIQEIANEEVKK